MRGEKEKLLGRGQAPAGQRQLPAAQGVSAMILGQSLPHGKTFFGLLGLPAGCVAHATRFLFGLLVTPTGLRLPTWRPYYTRDYCTRLGRPYQKPTELAARLVEQLRLPAGARVVVLGDTGFDANDLLAACARRQLPLVVSMNGDRVLAGPRRKTKVTDLAAGW